MEEENKMKLLKSDSSNSETTSQSIHEKNEELCLKDKPSYWKKFDITWNKDHSIIKSVLSTSKNHEIMIAEDEYLKDKIKLNELDKLIHFPNKFFVPRQWNDHHDQYVFEGIMSDKHISYIKTYLEQKYLKYKFKPKQDIIIEVLDHIAWDNRYNPIKDYIKYCHQQWLIHNQPDMITNLFPKYLGTDKNETNDLISKIWLTELVTRPFDINKVADYVLNLVGPQGCGKTLMFNLLSSIPNNLSDISLENSKPYRTTWKYSPFDNKDLELNMIKSWIVVDEEMNVRKKLSPSEYKDTVSSMVGQKDIRAPYRRNAELYDVFCTLGATSNLTEFLNDPTGNRRELPLLCNPDNAVKSLRYYSDDLAEECWHDCQLAIGQAYQLYLDGYKYYQRSKVELDMLNEATEQFKEQDSADNELELYLENKDIVLVEELVRRINNFSSLPNNQKVTANKINKLMLKYSNQWIKKRGKLNKQIKEYYQNPDNSEKQELSTMLGDTLADKIRDKQSNAIIRYYARKNSKFH